MTSLRSQSQTSPPARASYAARAKALRCARRHRVAAMVHNPTPHHLKTFDPLDAHQTTRSVRVASMVAVCAGALALHAVVLGMIALTSDAQSAPRSQTPTSTLVIVEPPQHDPLPTPQPPKETTLNTPVLKPQPPQLTHIPKRVRHNRKPRAARRSTKLPKPPETPSAKTRPPRIGVQPDATTQASTPVRVAPGDSLMGTQPHIAPAASSAQVHSGLGTSDTQGSNNHTASQRPRVPASFTKPRARGSMRKPPYPALLRRRNIEGDVVVSVTVSPTGTVSRVQLVRPSKHSAFNTAAIEQARKQRFTPAMKIEGSRKTAVPYTIRYTYRFRLQ